VAARSAGVPVDLPVFNPCESGFLADSYSHYRRLGAVSGQRGLNIMWRVRVIGTRLGRERIIVVL
jgi:hypothetical protein